MGSSEPSRVRQWALESCLTLTPPPRQKWPTEPAEARPPGNTGVRGQAWALGPGMGSGAPLGSRVPKNELPALCLLPGVAPPVSFEGKAGHSGWCSESPHGRALVYHAGGRGSPMVVPVFLARLTGKRKLHSLPRGLHTGQEGWWSDPGPMLETSRPSLCPCTVPAPKAWGYVVLCPLSPQPCAPMGPMTAVPKPFTQGSQSLPSTLCLKLGDLPPAANWPLSPAGVWREDRHSPGRTDQLCGLACPPTFFPQLGTGPSNVLGLPVTFSGAPVWSGAGSRVGPTERPGVLPRCRKHVPLGPATPRKSWGLEPPLTPGFGRLVFSRSVLFPGKPGNNFCQFFLCRLLLSPGRRVLRSWLGTRNLGLGPAGQHPSGSLTPPTPPPSPTPVPICSC